MEHRKERGAQGSRLGETGLSHPRLADQEKVSVNATRHLKGQGDHDYLDKHGLPNHEHTYYLS